MASKKWLRVLGVASLVLALSNQGAAQVRDYSDKAEIDEFQRLATETLHLHFDKIVKSGAERNALGIRSESLLFSRRLDSRTFFVQDLRYGEGRPAGAFEGTDDNMRKQARVILGRMKIPAAELGKDLVLTENRQEGHRDASGKIIVDPPYKGRRMVLIERRVEGIPVFSSYLKLSLNKEGQIGYMELHWPEIPEHVVTEAHRLAYKVEHGWRAPEQPGAKVESVQAGVVHSSAFGFLMDIYPAIRVVYAPTEKTAGKKPLYYYDRNGKPVPRLRQFEVACPEAKEERRAPKPSGAEPGGANPP
jgi:hypothetical protein